MRLLVFTQKVDQSDPVLGFMVSWLRVLACQVERLEIICLEKGEYNLPSNTRVYSLGKERGKNKLKYLFNFYRYLWKLRSDYDAVWVHMNQIYVILGWPVWSLFHRPIGFWYAHGSVSPSLKLAVRLVDLIFTSSASGFRLMSKKLNIIGQGIDTEQFNFNPDESRQSGRLVSVGRLSPVKRQYELVKALSDSQNNSWRLEILGGPVTDIDSIYVDALIDLIAELNLSSQVILVGPVKHESLPDRLRQADLFVTMSRTGSLDKVVLEAMAAGVIPVVLGDTFKPVLGDYAETLSAFDEADWSAKVAQVLSWSAAEKLKARLYLRQQIVSHHSLLNLMTKIVSIFNNV